MRACALRESEGKITKRGSFAKPEMAWRGMAAKASGAGTSMLAQPWSTRVVGRRITGQPWASESSKAASVMA